MLRAAFTALLLGTVPAAAVPVDALSESRRMTQAEMAETVDFMVGNAVFALLQAAGHMAADVFRLPVDGERGADDFATFTLLEPRSAAGDQTLVNAIDTWYLSDRLTASTDGTSVPIGPHALDLTRANAITCRMVGADPQGFSDIADAVALAPAARDRCVADYARDRAAFDAILAPFRRPAAAAKSAVRTVYDPAPAELELEATVLSDNRVLEEVGDRLADHYLLPDGVTVRAAPCGSPTAEWKAGEKELVLCYELSAIHAALIIDDIRQR